MRRYGELYSLIRLETLDSLDRLPELVNSEELKNKLLFSVVVVSKKKEMRHTGVLDMPNVS